MPVCMSVCVCVGGVVLGLFLQFTFVLKKKEKKSKHENTVEKRW